MSVRVENSAQAVTARRAREGLVTSMLARAIARKESAMLPAIQGVRSGTSSIEAMK